MALTFNGKRTGRAGASDLADTREMIREAQEKAYQEQVNEKYLREERELQLAMGEKYGDVFWNWYDSPAVPQFGRASERIRLIKEWEANQPPSLLDGMLAPAVGYIQDNRVHWTTEEPPTYRAVWNDSPDSVTFEKQTALREQGGGQEAMKKPAKDIIQQ